MVKLPVTGIIIGTVSHASKGRKLNGAVVETDTGQSATTEKGGNYTLNGVPSGTRAVTVSKAGYVTQPKPATVFVNQTTTSDFALNPESTSDEGDNGGPNCDKHPNHPKC